MSDESRFLELLRAHGPAIARIAALYELDPAEREDLVQEIWLAIWRALPRFRGESGVRTFLFRIAHNRAVSHVQKRSRAAKPAGELPELEDPRANPARDAEASQTVERLLQALHRLPWIDRQIVQMSLDGLPQSEIGEVLGVRENHVAVRLHRARRRLRELMEGRDG